MTIDRETRKALEQAFRDIQNGGGSIYGIQGGNVGADGTSGMFMHQVESTCWADPESMRMMAEAISLQARWARETAEQNEIDTTNPKCHSIPLIYLKTGCQFAAKRGPRNRAEQSCSGGEVPEQPET